MRVERLIYSILILAAALAAILHWRRGVVLKVENEHLRAEIDSLQTEVRNSSNVIDLARAQSERLRKQTSELMQLRNEITQLRGDSKKADTLLTENHRLKVQLAQAAAAASQLPATNRTAEHFPRASWTFAGYGSPEAALVSAIWSMKEGNARSYLESLAPSEQERMAKAWQNKSEGEIAEKHKSDVAAISGLRVLQQENTAAGEVIMNVLLEGVERVEKIRMSQVGQDWKFGGFIREPDSP